MEVEIGTISNPIIFSGVIAGQPFEHPSNPFILWNDKGGIINSADAKDIIVNVIGMNILDELVGLSDGSSGQTFTVAFIPVIQDDVENPLVVKVNGIGWTLVGGFTGMGPSDEVFTFNFVTGLLTFGNGIEGKIPLLGNTIQVTYSPNKVEYGKEVEEFNWLGIRSFGVVSNSKTISLEREKSTDNTHVTVAHQNLVSVSGIWLGTDSHRGGTNYFTGGSFNSHSGQITLGTALPDPNIDVLIDYIYAITDDLEADYTQIGRNVSHEFDNPIPSNNAKLIYLRISAPDTTSPTGLLNLAFRIRLTFNT